MILITNDNTRILFVCLIHIFKYVITFADLVFRNIYRIITAIDPKLEIMETMN